MLVCWAAQAQLLSSPTLKPILMYHVVPGMVAKVRQPLQCRSQELDPHDLELLWMDRECASKSVSLLCFACMANLHIADRVCSCASNIPAQQPACLLPRMGKLNQASVFMQRARFN